MDRPPDGNDGDLTEQRSALDDEQGAPGRAAAATAKGLIETRLPFGSGAEGLCRTIPELGSMPYVQDRERGRRVVRLVSTNLQTDLAIELQAGVNKVGRQRIGNHIVLCSAEVSRYHAEVHVSDQATVVKDLGSSNGTFVNGARITEQRAEGGDLIAFSTEFVFQLQIDMAMQAPEVVTLHPGGQEPLPATDPPPSVADEIPSSLEERRRELEEAPAAALPGPSRPATAAYPVEAPASRASRMEPPASAAPAPPPAPPSPAPPARLAHLRPVRPPDSAAAPPKVAAAPAPPAPEPSPLPVSFGPENSPFIAERPQDASRANSPFIAERPQDASRANSLAGSSRPPARGTGVDAEFLDRQRRQLAVLYQVSKRCMAAQSLGELDRLLINVLERIVAFQRGFITYQLLSGDWKLVMSPKGDRWDRSVVRGLLQTALRTKVPVLIKNTAADDRLGSPGSGRGDTRLLLPLRTSSAPVGAVFLISIRSDAFDDQTVDFLSLFSDIAALAVVSCSRLEGQKP